MTSLHSAITYGPIHSRRLGASLGVNVLPPGRKTCNFNCCYCQYGWTPQPTDRARLRALPWPPPRSIAAVVGNRLRLARERQEAIDCITVAGDGEPTLHPEFAAVAEELRTVRDAWLPDVPLAILSNASTLDEVNVRRAMLSFDQRYLKLDAGDAVGLRRINGSPMNLASLITHLTELPGIVLQ
jgi:wyosine [tRNA(Phe)-imidazoG37] synthetase (radical SAM superfamily)